MPKKVKLVDENLPPKLGNDYSQSVQPRTKYVSRYEEPSSKGAFLIACLIFLALIGGGYYYFFHYGKPAHDDLNKATEPKVVTEERLDNNIVLIQELSPDETYMSYQEGGTGFIMEWRGKVFLVTNVHVLAGMESPHFLTISGHDVEVDLDNIYLARNEDVAVVEITNYRTIFPEYVLPTKYDPTPKAESETDGANGEDGASGEEVTADDSKDGEKTAAPAEKPKRLFRYAYQPLEALEDVEFNVKDGDKITVYGNSLGKRLVQMNKGRINGLGHNIFRHTADVKPGNSGSPIIHNDTGKVMGIVSYAMIYYNGETQDEMYAFRLDNITDWQHIGNWKRFQRVNERYEAIAQRTQDLYKLSKGFADVKVYNDIELRNIFTAYKNRVASIRNGRAVSSADMQDSISRASDHFLTSVENLLWQDIDEFLNANSREWTYNYFRIQVLEQRKYREMIQKSIEIDRFHLQDSK
ncbi:MAG: S1 family peptidase [Puniceicoccales bacterium]